MQEVVKIELEWVFLHEVDLRTLNWPFLSLVVPLYTSERLGQGHKHYHNTNWYIGQLTSLKKLIAFCKVVVEDV